ncbi:MAG: bifunctional heptose 7-phosphate kinase/heptose 1-phosphate adenyltransferase, partial [Nanoarchaeota archaeon]
TAVAASALSIAAGADLVDACKIGNYAAGIVVGKLGTTSTNTKELEQAIKDDE